eukprot:scaffold24028_cov180-Amphora_coffeaeformis.AAC.2
MLFFAGVVPNKTEDYRVRRLSNHGKLRLGCVNTPIRSTIDTSPSTCNYFSRMKPRRWTFSTTPTPFGPMAEEEDSCR